MRPTKARMGDMPGGKVYNLWWGDKHGAPRLKGVTQYSLSPFRQRAAKGMVSGYLFNGFRRLSEQFVYWSVPFALGYGIYSWAKRVDAYQISKAGHVAAMEAGGGEGH